MYRATNGSAGHGEADRTRKTGKKPRWSKPNPIYFIILLCSTRDDTAGCCVLGVLPCASLRASVERIVFPRATPTPRTRSAARHWPLEDARELGFLDDDRVAPTIYRTRRRVLDADTRCYDFHKSNRHGVVRLNGLSPWFFITSSRHDAFFSIVSHFIFFLLFRICTLLSCVFSYQIGGKLEETDPVKNIARPVVSY